MQQLQPDTTLQGGKYKIIRTLGQGGFGITYLAEQVMLDRKVAIKEFFMKEYCDRDESTSRVTMGSEGSRESVNRYREKFLKEARNIAKLSHPNIVKIIDVFEENGTAYYVMEYAEGGSLADKVKREGYLSESVATRYIMQVAEALAYVHARKMNHLDVKPANIMLTGTDTAVLIDFGLSKQYNVVGQQTSTTPVGISEGYAPMEQYKQGGVGEFSPETDIYALGATFFKLLTGITPPSASDVNEDGVPVDELKAKGVSDKAIEVICEAMKSRKKERMKDVRGFINALGDTKDRLTSMVEGDEVTMMDVKNTEDGDNIEAKKGKNIKKTERFLIKGPEWKGNLIIAILTIVILGIVSIPMGLGNYLKKITQIEEAEVEYSIEGIAKTLSRQTCRIENSKISDGLMVVSCNMKKGFMNTSGEIVVPCKYEDVKPFSESLAGVCKGGKWGYIDKLGKEIVPCKYDGAASFSEGLACVRKNGKRGYIDKLGKEVVSCKYDVIFYGHICLDSSFSVFSSSFSEGLACVMKEDNGRKFGFIDKSGKEVISCNYDWAYPFSESVAWVLNSGGELFGLIDKSGNEILPYQYKYVTTFSEGLAGVSKGDKWGYIDKSGKEVIPCIYETVSWEKRFNSFSEGLACVKKEGKYGYIDKSGNVIIPCKYEDAHSFHDGLAGVCKGGKWGFIDQSGKVIIPFLFTVVSDFSEGLAIVKKDGLMFGVIDKKGKCTYDYYKRENQLLNPDLH